MSTSAHFAFQPQPRTDINRRTSTNIGHPSIVPPDIDRRTLTNINYLPIVPPNIDHLKNLAFVKEATNIDHIIDQSIFPTLPDHLKQGLLNQNDPRNTLCVPVRLNSIKGIIKETSQGLNNTKVFVSWGACNNAQTALDIYLIVRLESKSLSHNKINSARRNVSFILRDPWTQREPGDDTDYMNKMKETIKGFDTNPGNIIHQLHSSNFQSLIQLIV